MSPLTAITPTNSVSNENASFTQTKPTTEDGFYDKEADIEFTSDHSDETINVKFLVSRVTAGGIIGKQGAQINSLQEKHNVRLKISAPHELFPGTECRVCCIIGRLADVMTCMNAILVRDVAGLTAVNPEDAAAAFCELRLILPAACAGSVIGKKGQCIQKIREDAGCKVLIMNPVADTNERLCPISGSIEGVLLATRFICSRLVQDPRYEIQSNMQMSYGSPVSGGYRYSDPNVHGSPSMRLSPRWQGSSNKQFFVTQQPTLAETLKAESVQPMLPYGGMMPPVRPGKDSRHSGRVLQILHSLTMRPEIIKAPSSIDIAIPSDAVGFIVGKGGRRINELRAITGAKLFLTQRKSQQGDYEDATEEEEHGWRLSVSGSVSNVLIAYAVIVEQLLLRDTRGSPTNAANLPTNEQ